MTAPELVLAALSAAKYFGLPSPEYKTAMSADPDPMDGVKPLGFSEIAGCPPIGWLQKQVPHTHVSGREALDNVVEDVCKRIATEGESAGAGLTAVNYREQVTSFITVSTRMQS